MCLSVWECLYDCVHTHTHIYTPSAELKNAGYKLSNAVRRQNKRAALYVRRNPENRPHAACCMLLKHMIRHGNKKNSSYYNYLNNSKPV